MFARLSAAAGFTDWRKLRVRWMDCPLCERRRFMVRLSDNEIAIRCVGCGASAVTLSLVSVLRQLEPMLADRHVYELSARGALFKYLNRHAGKLTTSEYLDGVRSGESRNGVQCQDVQRLTYPDASFDVCTSTEVFEHVPDDRRGFRQIHRVLKPGGMMIFTVPLRATAITVERARRDEAGSIEHWLPPEYHGDPIRGGGSVLAFRNYGHDIVDRLRQAGFATAEIIRPPDPMPWGYARPVLRARKR
jgi:SAM-dependent methyltransferase